MPRFYLRSKTISTKRIKVIQKQTEKKMLHYHVNINRFCGFYFYDSWNQLVLHRRTKSFWSHVVLKAKIMHVYQACIKDVESSLTLTRKILKKKISKFLPKMARPLEHGKSRATAPLLHSLIQP